MKAVVFHDVGDIRLDEVPDPQILEPADAIVRITDSAICGTDLHFVRGTMPGMEAGTILGHEAVGVVEELGPQVRNLEVGDRVVVPSTIGCGNCSYCRAGYYAQCDNANPNGPQAGTAFYGGPAATGPFDGLQAEFARVPMAHVNLVKLWEGIDSAEALMVSDIFPTGWFGADLAGVEPGKTVAVLGAGPVGQFAIASAKLMGAGRVLVVDQLDDRLDLARRQVAETIDFSSEDPVEAIRELTGGIGVDCLIDAVGADAEAPHHGHAAERSDVADVDHEAERDEVSGEADADGEWPVGSGPSQALRWSINAVAKAGTVSIIGVYPPTSDRFPIGAAMQRNLTIRMGNCNHRRYVPKLLDLVREGALRPDDVITRDEPLTDVLDAYKAFDDRNPGWMKVRLAT